MNLANKTFKNIKTGEVIKVIDSFEDIAILENIKKINPEIAEVYAKLGSCFSSVGNIEKTIKSTTNFWMV